MDAATGTRASALDDLATVWAGVLHRRPRAWALGFACVATIALLSGGGVAPVFVVAAAVVAARGLPPWSWRRACLVGVGAVAVPALVDSGDSAAARALVPWAAAVAAAVGTLAWTRTPRGDGASWAVVVVMTAAAGAVGFRASGGECFVTAALLAAAFCTAIVARDARSGFAWAAAGVGSVAQMTSQFTDLTAAGGGVSSWGRLFSSVAVWGAFVPVVRAMARERPTDDETDAASAQLVVRVQRHPWTTGFLCCAIGGLFQPAAAARELTLGDWAESVWPTPSSAALPFVALLAVGERSVWAFCRFVVLVSVGGAIQLALHWGGASASWGPPVEAWFVLGVPWVQFAVAWIAGRRHPVEWPDLALFSGATGLVVATLALMPVAILGDTMGLVLVAALACGWTVVFHRLATTSWSGPALLAVWCAANLLGAAVFVGCRVAWSIRSGEEVLDRLLCDEGSRLMLSALCAAALSVLHGAICVGAARRVRSMTVVPDRHPIIADFAVDLRGGGGASTAAR